MNLKSMTALLVAAALGCAATLAYSGAADAHAIKGWHHGWHYGWHMGWHRYSYAPTYYYVAPTGYNANCYRRDWAWIDGAWRARWVYDCSGGGLLGGLLPF